jgi:hypothetical protein
MLEPLFGTLNKENVLLYVYARGEGYPRGVAKFFATELRSIQNQFENLESGGVLSSRMVGNTRLYTFNPAYPFLAELKAMLGKVLALLPENERELLEVGRRRSA